MVFQLLPALTLVAPALAVDDQLYQKMAYTYVRDPIAPTFVSRYFPLFSKLGPNDVTTGTRPIGTKTQSTSEHEQDQATAVQKDLSLGASYGGFKATMHTSYNKLHSTSKHTMKSIRSFIFNKFHVTVNPNKLWDYIPKEHQDALLTEAPDRVRQRFGEFYVPTFADYGGVFRSMFSREMSQKEDSSQVAQGMEAQYFSTGIKANMGVQNKMDDYAMTTFFSMQTFGGDPLKLAGGGDLDSKEAAWAASIKDDTLFPTKLGLSPIWEVLPAEHKDRAKQLQTYFTQLWDREDAAVPQATDWAVRDCAHSKIHSYWCTNYGQRRRRNDSGWGIKEYVYCPDGCRLTGRGIRQDWCNDNGGFMVCRTPYMAAGDAVNASSTTDVSDEEPPEQNGLGDADAPEASLISV